MERTILPLISCQRDRVFRRGPSGPWDRYSANLARTLENMAPVLKVGASFPRGTVTKPGVPCHHRPYTFPYRIDLVWETDYVEDAPL